MSPRATVPAWPHPAERWAVNTIFQREANHMATSERGTPSVTLTPQGQAGLRGYLAGPILKQLRTTGSRAAEEVTLVYGHTHKPFVYRWPVRRLPRTGSHLQHRRLGGRHGPPAPV